MLPNVVDQTFLERLGLSPSGVEYVLNVASSPPSRKVGVKRRRNLILEVPMQSIGAVLQAESLSGEYSFLLELDRNTDLKAAYDQPCAVTLEITDRNGRRTRTTYTPDYLVAYGSSVCAVEIKADHALTELTRQRPTDWQLHEGAYRYLPAKRLFAEMGIDHIVLPTSTFNPIRADNLALLFGTRSSREWSRYRKLRHGILDLVRHEHTMLLSDILERIGDPDTTPVLQLIDSGKLFTDIDDTTLTDATGVWISVDDESHRHTKRSVTDLRAYLGSMELTSADVLDPRYEADVAIRLAIADGTTSNGRRGKLVSDRTMRRYRNALRHNGGDPKSLQPGWSRCGNREPRIGNVHLSFLREHIHLCKSDPTDPSIHKSYLEYHSLFGAAREKLEFFDSKPVSRSTFYELWSKLARSEDAFGKGGRRLENAEADSIDPKVKSLVASRPYAVAHIDHWKCDLFVVVGEINGKKITRRPWLTAMVDAFSGEVLAIWLSFSDPSKKSCTMVIRDCVRRHGRLPELIVTDGGSDFRSSHFLVMLASLGVVRCERPPEDPRFGIEVERLFGHFKERFARGLPGYGLSLEKSRAVSGSFKSEKRATLSLLDAFEVLEAYTFHGYNQNPKPGEMSSRYALRDRSLRQYPHSGRLTEWNLKLLVATSIEAPGAEYKLWPGRGLHVEDKWYTCDRLSFYRGYKKDLIVRLEPYADSIVYVCIDGKWLVCMNSSARLQFSTSEMSFIVASSERRDLRALRKELENEQTRCAAEVVDDTLKRIAERKESHPPTTTSVHDDDDGIEKTSPWSQLNFDDIAPCENEKR